jgi:hypothetical protein
MERRREQCDVSESESVRSFPRRVALDRRRRRASCRAIGCLIGREIVFHNHRGADLQWRRGGPWKNIRTA